MLQYCQYVYIKYNGLKEIIVYEFLGRLLQYLRVHKKLCWKITLLLITIAFENPDALFSTLAILPMWILLVYRFLLLILLQLISLF